MSTIGSVSRSSAVVAGPASAAEGGGGVESVLPPPLEPLAPVVAEDLVTALAMLSIRQKNSERRTADEQRIAATAAQESAHAAKIEAMRELASDVFARGLVEGLLDGASAVCTLDAAFEDHKASLVAAKDPAKVVAKADIVRTARIEDAVAGGFKASSKVAGAAAGASQEGDREDIAAADAAVDRAKSAAESAASSARRAEEDIEETINAIRSYLAAKTQLLNAGVMKG